MDDTTIDATIVAMRSIFTAIRPWYVTIMWASRYSGAFLCRYCADTICQGRGPNSIESYLDKYRSDSDDLGTVEKLTVSAFQRFQADRYSSRYSPIKSRPRHRQIVQQTIVDKNCPLLVRNQHYRRVLVASAYLHCVFKR